MRENVSLPFTGDVTLPVEAVQPIGNPYIGVGQGDPGAWPWLMGGFEVVKAGRLDTVKLLAGDNLEVDYKVMDTLYGLGVKFVVARLFYAGAPASSQQFIDSFINSAVNLYRKGVRWFEVHNEPNLLAEWTGTPEEWAAFMREVIQLLRPAMPEAKFLYPGLSPGGADASVGRAYSEQDFFNRSYPLVKELCAGICIHCYFTNDAEAQHQALVANTWAAIHGKPIIVSEFSNPVPGVPKAEKARQYVVFLSGLGNVVAAHGFVMQSSAPRFASEVWQGSEIVSVIGQYMEGRS